MATKRHVKGKHLANDGARSLRASGKTMTEIGRLVGKSRQAVTKWLDGKALPDESSRRRLQALGLAPAEAWTQPPAEGVAPASAMAPTCHPAVVVIVIVAGPNPSEAADGS